MKKTLVILLALLPLLVCAAEPVVLRVSWWGTTERNEATRNALRLFEIRNPGVRIRAESGAFDNYEAHLASQLHAGAEPDVMQINWSWLSAYSRRGDGFLNLFRYRPLLRLEEFAGDSYKSGLSFGRLNGLPASNTAYVFLWQKSTFDRAGIDVPRTWEQLLLAAQVFREKLGADYYLLDGEPRATFMLSHAYIMQKTGKPYIYPNQPKVGLTRDELLDWVRFHRRLYREHVVAPYDSPRRLAGRAVHLQPEWVAGHWAGCYTFDSTLKSRTSTLPATTRIEIGDFLTMPGAKNSGMFGRPSMMLAVGRNTKNPEMAAKLVAFLLHDPEAARLLGSTRGVPLTEEAYQVVAPALYVHERRAHEQIRKTRMSAPSPYFESAQIYDLLNDVFVRVARGRISDEQAADRLLEEGNRIVHQLVIQPH